MPSLSVIIPTRQRARILTNCLDHLARQTIANDLEVIVVSDGRDEDTEFLFLDPPWKGLAIQFIEIGKSQQGVARNRGVAQASAPVCMFIGDDIFLAHDACEKHVTAHEKSQKNSKSHIPGPMSDIVVLGFTTWDSQMEITPVMRYLERSGWQFGYPLIASYAHNFIPRSMQHRFTYTSHISVSREVAKAQPFREDIELYGWEDIEWGTRLKNDGVRLYYEPDAKAVHHHSLNLEQSLQRMETLGESAVRMSKLVPGLDCRPTGLKLLTYKIAAMFETMDGQHRKAFLKGMEDAT